jgi:hypothetical protein
LRDKDIKKSERVMSAILHMTKPDVQRIRDAYQGQTTS